LRSIGEIRSLTGLRGVAAMYVLFFHYFPFATEAEIRTPFARIVDHGYLAVDLFFVLSGFVMAMNYGQAFASGPWAAAYRTFLGRRIARIYPLYLAATVAGFILVLLGWLGYEATVPVGVALAANLLMVQAWGIGASFDSPAWSISTEWAAYLAFPVLVTATAFGRPTRAWISGALCVVALAGLCALGPPFAQAYNLRAPLNLNGYWYALPVLRCIPEFTLGLLAYRLASTGAGRRLAASRWIAPLLCVLIVGLLALRRSDLAVVLGFALLVPSVVSDAHWPGTFLASRPIEFLGTLSYSIYLTHKLAYGLLSAIYSRAHAAGIPHAESIAAITCIVLTIPIAYVAYRTIEVPSRRWLRTLFEGPDARAIRSAPLPTKSNA
jgi:peptidoglycan/LPS O-acetylase OafA/YrhL